MKAQAELTEMLKSELMRQGATLVGIGNLSVLPLTQRYGLPFGVSVVVKHGG